MEFRPPETPEMKADSERKLTEMAAVVRGWRPILEQPLAVRPRSSLAKDDEAYREYPASQVAWTGIVSAVDSLDLLLTSITNTGRPHPTGHRVLARAALTSAALATWVLVGPREERIHHGLRAAWDDVSGERRAVQKMRDVDPEDDLDHYDRTLARLDERADGLVSDAKACGLTGSKLKDRPTFGEMLDYVVARMPQSDEEDLDQAYSFVLSQLNGSVHALRWASLLTATDVENGEDGAVVRLLTTATDLFYLSAGGTILTQYALDTYRKRSVEH